MAESKRIIIGYDGSSASQAIFADLKRAGLPPHLEAIVLSAIDFTPPNWIDMATINQSVLVEEIESARSNALEYAEKISKEACDRLKAQFPGWKVSPEAHSVSAAQALVTKAEKWNADLIVMGAHGHSQLGRFLGSVSQLVLMQAPCSVRISRSPAESSPGVKILIGVDGSLGSDAAMKTVQGRFWPSSTEARVLSALYSHPTLQMTHMVPPDLKAVRPVSGQQRMAVNQMVEKFSGELRKVGVEAQALVREGDPKHLLVAEAESWKADCIFMGARGLSSLRRFLLGSVSMAVAARAHSSVEVVRSKDQASNEARS
ncbi:MAG: hypothetical protein KCHDKBKB_01368 [Elusimicrobia bacterium]|nr:hypothetical protein [Elusimicrobiota bacterium]